jgi:protein phosphatase 1L
MPSGPTPRVDLSKKQLNEIPNEQLVNSTRTLLLHENALTALPMQFAVRQSQLRVLYLNENRLSTWPEALSELKFLEKLHLESNQLTVVPSSVGRLSSLRKLYLHNNRISSLPSDLGALRQLTHLSLHSNAIVALPCDLALCDALVELHVGNNPLQSPPSFACNKGVAFLRLYLRMMRASDALVGAVPRPRYRFHRDIVFDSPSVGDKPQQLQQLQQLQPHKAALTASAPPSSAASAAASAESGSGSNTSSPSATATIKRRFKRRTTVASTVRTNTTHSLLYFLAEVDGMCSQNQRPYMEDRSAVIECCAQRRPTSELEAIENLFSRIMMLGVFDGHGGQHASEYVRRHLLATIANQSAFRNGDFVTALRRAFAVVDDALVKWLWERRNPCGSTAAVVLLVDNVVYVAHAGDTRALLCRDKMAFALTSDHTPARESERIRIEARGGEVSRNPRGGPMRVNGMLAVSRSFGDVLLKPNAVVTSEPDVCVEPLSPADEWLIMATDGLFDVMSNQSAVDVVRRCASPREAATKLVRLACTGPDSGDNVSVLVVRLHWTIDMLGGRNKRPTASSATASGGGGAAQQKARVTEESMQRALQMPSIRATLRGGDLLERSGRLEQPQLAAPSNKRASTPLAANVAPTKAPREAAQPVKLDERVLIKLLMPSVNGSKAVLHRCDPAQTIGSLHAELCVEHGLNGATFQLCSAPDGAVLSAAVRMDSPAVSAAASIVLKRTDEPMPGVGRRASGGASATGDDDTVVDASAERVSRVEYATLRGNNNSDAAAAKPSLAAQFAVSNEGLPPNWHSGRLSSGRVFYFNTELQVTAWQNPATPVRAPWQAVTTLGNKIYYHNTKTGRTAWTCDEGDREEAEDGGEDEQRKQQ